MNQPVSAREVKAFGLCDAIEKELDEIAGSVHPVFVSRPTAAQMKTEAPSSPLVNRLSQILDKAREIRGGIEI